MMRHKNGGGARVDQADVAARVWLDRESLASEHSSCDSGHISKSVIHGDSVIVNSKIISSTVNVNRISDSYVWASQLGHRVVVRSSHLEQVTLSGPVMAESATLIGPWSLEIPPANYLSDYLRIAGRWNRVPRWFAGNNYYIVEGGDETLWVGCKRRDFQHWLDNYGLGRRLGEPASRIKAFIESLIVAPSGERNNPQRVRESGIAV